MATNSSVTNYSNPDDALILTPVSSSFSAAVPAAQSQNHSLFAQLRSQFPTGALISELVQVQDGQFVVRAIVQVGGTTLATGMAAADKVEIAEDRARVRAMEVLGISPAAESTPFERSTRLTSELPKSPEPSIAPAFESIALTEAPLPPVDAIVPKVTMSEPVKKSARKKKEEPPEVEPASDLMRFAPLEMPEVKSEPPAFEMEYSYTETPEFEESESSAPEPIDLSDAIAQIGAEIERIGWTKKQGSTYLQQTYGKKTRAELTEDELLEFLHYLKALPSKGHPSLSQIPF